MESLNPGSSSLNTDETAGIVRSNRAETFLELMEAIAPFLPLSRRPLNSRRATSSSSTQNRKKVRARLVAKSNFSHFSQENWFLRMMEEREEATEPSPPELSGSSPSPQSKVRPPFRKHKRPFMIRPLSELVENGRRHWTNVEWESAAHSLLAKKASFSIYDDAVIFLVIRNSVQKNQAFRYLAEVTRKSVAVLTRRYSDLGRSSKGELLVLTEMALADPSRSQKIAGIFRRRKIEHLSVTHLNRAFYSIIPHDLLHRLYSNDFDWQSEPKKRASGAQDQGSRGSENPADRKKRIQKAAPKKKPEIQPGVPRLVPGPSAIRRNKLIRRKLKKLLGRMFQMEEASEFDINKQISIAERGLKVLNKYLASDFWANEPISGEPVCPEIPPSSSLPNNPPQTQEVLEAPPILDHADLLYAALASPTSEPRDPAPLPPIDLK